MHKYKGCVLGSLPLTDLERTVAHSLSLLRCVLCVRNICPDQITEGGKKQECSIQQHFFVTLRIISHGPGTSLSVLTQSILLKRVSCSALQPKQMQIVHKQKQTHKSPEILACPFRPTDLISGLVRVHVWAPPQDGTHIERSRLWFHHCPFGLFSSRF